MQAYYDLFQCWVRYRVGFNLLSCIYVDVCLWNVNQYYREKKKLLWHIQETETCCQLQNWLFQIYFLSKLSTWMAATYAGNTKLEFYCSFKNKLLSSIRPSKRSMSNVNDPEGFKCLKRSRLTFSQLNELTAVRRLNTMKIFSCPASISKMLESPYSSTYQALIHLSKIFPVICYR